MSPKYLIVLALAMLVACPAPATSDDDDDSAGDDDDSAGDDDDSAGDDDDSAGDDDDETVEPTPLGEPTGWRSSLYPDSWSPGFGDSEGRALQDFSYAGYRLGNEGVPDDPPGPVLTVTDPAYGADPTGGEDATTAIQMALDDAGEAGGGIVYLPPGTYRIRPQTEDDDAALYLQHDGVVLRGAGRSETFVFNDETTMRGREVILVSPPASASWSSASGAVTLSLTADALDGDMAVSVSDADGFSPGDWVVLRGDASDAWLADHDMTDGWDDRIRGPMFLRQVAGTTDTSIMLDVPLRSALLTRDNARIYAARPHLHEVGLEDFSIGMLEHPGSGWGDNDYNVEGTGAWDVHGSDVIQFSYVIDSWVQRVHSYRPLANDGPYHLLSDGISLWNTRGITIRGCIFGHPQYEGGGGNGYAFVLSGSETLFEHCAARSARHGFSYKSAHTMGNVLLDCTSVNPRLALDFHMQLSSANLLDNTLLEADFIDATYRPYGSSLEHGHTTSRSIIWNTTGQAYHPSQDVVVDTRQYDWGAAIGTQGPAVDVRTLPLLDSRDTAPEDLAEGVGAGGTLIPASLYRDQLSRRLEGTPLDRTVPMRTVEPSADAYVQDGEDASRNFGTDGQLRVKDAGTGYARRSFLRFDLSEVAEHVVGARLRLDGRSSDGGGTQADVRVHLVEDDWSEDTITWDSQPPLGPELSRQIVNDVDGLWAFDLLQEARSASASGGQLDLALGQDMGGSGLMTRFDSREGSNPPVLELLLDPRPWLPYSIEYASPGDEGTSSAYLTDDDLGTRWSNQTWGATVNVGLEGTQMVSGVAVAAYQGTQRLAFFSVQTSEDGVRWEPALDGWSSGLTGGLEHFSFPERAAGWVRLQGWGNSESDWNSFTELRILGAP